ncbi:kelch-like protein 3 isoform X2 [Acyrthosiphon pisum]|nr:kelch-like protein 3 isoform X2 [Acyrthosiphon pisum]|eukprot:XP_016658313.1 PREDICTED: kelch-like protein 3 isoform X2 [Acyrthosiphon pisum]
MDSEKRVIPWTSGQKQVVESNGCKPKIYINSYHTHNLFQVLQSLHSEKVLRDTKLETDGSVIVNAHKVVLVSASPYFCAMFTSFAEGDKDSTSISYKAW